MDGLNRRRSLTISLFAQLWRTLPAHTESDLGLIGSKNWAYCFFTACGTVVFKVYAATSEHGRWSRL
jgi:hypothetical protein